MFNNYVILKFDLKLRNLQVITKIVDESAIIKFDYAEGNNNDLYSNLIL